MKSKLICLSFLCAIFFSQSLLQAEDIDKELSVLADKLTVLIKDNAKKKVTVLDFTDLQGGSTELGKYIAEELTVNLVMGKREFSVLDRANLRKILAEHKLTASGLVDPENAKKLGLFAGVDALIVGTMISKGSNTSLNAKIITTDTAEIIGAARVEFKADENVQKLNSQPTTASANTDDGPSIFKTLGTLRLELQPLQIVDGSQYLLRITITNQAKKAAYVALSSDLGNNVKGSLTDSEGNEFYIPWDYVSSIELTSMQNGDFFHATEIKPGDAIAATVKFTTRSGKTASPGKCNLQLEFLVGNNWQENFGKCRAYNVQTKIEAKHH